MTLQTQLLDVRVVQALARAQQPMTAASAADAPGAAGFALPAGLMADLQRFLRQIGQLQRERSAIESGIAAASAEQRRQAEARLVSFDADLARLLGHAARLAFLLLAARQRSGVAVGIVDGARAVQQLGTVFGRPLDSARVRRSVQQFAVRPIGAADGVEPGALVETLFIALALVAAQLPRGGATA